MSKTFVNVHVAFCHRGFQDGDNFKKFKYI